jgi:hypothetical protein
MKKKRITVPFLCFVRVHGREIKTLESTSKRLMFQKDNSYSIKLKVSSNEKGSLYLEAANPNPINKSTYKFK